MIYDRIDNLNYYKGISQDICEGLSFLKQATPDLALGVHQINPRVKALVSEYETRLQNECGFEAHKKYIDIQYILNGEERIHYLPIGKLKETNPYSEENDAAFFTANTKPQELTIGDGCFAIFFPQDGHMPQLCVNKSMLVKKVVIKVEIV